MRLSAPSVCVAALCLCTAGAAGATNVTLSGTVINSCVLTITTPGTLAPSTDGTRLGSEETGGVAAVMSVVATGAAPTINFAAPTLSGPSGSEDATTAVRYTSTGGANQAYTSSSSSRTMTGLLDTFTVNGRVTHATGFPAGQYTVTSVATCQQQ